MQVRQILKMKPSAEVVTVSPDLLVSDAVEVLAKRRIGAAVVSSDGVTVEGILSERDVVRELGRRGAISLEDRVRDIMTPNPKFCTPDQQGDDIFSRMTEGRFRHMPVIEDGVMIGLISIGDVVKAQISVLHMEKEALQGMIMGH